MVVVVVVVRFIAITQILRIQFDISMCVCVCACVAFFGQKRFKFDNVKSGALFKIDYIFIPQMCKIKHSTLFLSFTLLLTPTSREHNHTAKAMVAMAVTGKNFSLAITI